MRQVNGFSDEQEIAWYKVCLGVLLSSRLLPYHMCLVFPIGARGGFRTTELLPEADEGVQRKPLPYLLAPSV